MAIDARVRALEPQHTTKTDTRETLAHASQQKAERNLEDYFIVDVDSHREPVANWEEVLQYMDNPVMRSNALERWRNAHSLQYVSAAMPPGYRSQSMFGRIPHQAAQDEDLGEISVHREVALCRRAMDAFGIDAQVVFPTVLLGLGLAPVAEGEAQVAYAYSRWFTERICPEEPRIKFMPYLPLRSPEMCIRIIRETAGKPGVVGYLVTSVRYDAVWDNKYMPIYHELEDRGYPIGFHAGPTWDDQWMRTMNRFISMHALSFVHPNMVHMTNWIINGIPERFPGLKVIWIESGLAWVPFLMQRLDSEFLKRISEAPLLKRLPSEYMREMYYTSQPMERDDHDLLESTLKAINAERSLLYASDWPHWDFDLPSSIYDLPFLGDQAKRNILGETARKLFNL